MIINKKTYFIISDIFEKYPRTLPFRLLINKKFFIEITKDEFHKLLYKEAICKYMSLPIARIKSWTAYNRRSYIFEIDSIVLEEEILKVENEWFDKHDKFMKLEVVKQVWN